MIGNKLDTEAASSSNRAVEERCTPRRSGLQIKDMAAAGYIPGELSLFVLQGRNMPNKDVGKMDPYAKVTVGHAGHKGGMVKKTKIIEKGGSNVSWDEVLTFPLDGTQDLVTINVLDDDTVSDDPVGNVAIPVPDLLMNGGEPQWYALQLHNKPAGEISISATYRTYCIGVLVVTLHVATQLKDPDWVGKMDPYVILTLDNSPPKKSKVQKDAGASPNFDDEQFVFQMKGNEQFLTFELRDDDIGKDDFIGSMKLDLRELSFGNRPSYPEMGLPIVDQNGKHAGILRASLTFTPQ
jgi:Ca2+-dependent lipid-binding protein